MKIRLQDDVSSIINEFLSSKSYKCFNGKEFGMLKWYKGMEIEYYSDVNGINEKS